MALTDSLKTLLIETAKSLKVSARREGVSQGWMLCAMNLLYQLADAKLRGCGPQPKWCAPSLKTNGAGARYTVRRR